MAHRKIESGASVGEGKQKAPNTEHGPNKVFQDGAVPVSNKGSFRTLFSRVFRAHHVPDSPLPYAKSEYLNLTASIKDRMAVRILPLN